MAEPAQYTPSELAEIRDAFAAGSDVSCPRCQAHMTVRPIGGGSFGLGYARSRQWLICTGCRRSAIFDLRRGTRT